MRNDSLRKKYILDLQRKSVLLSNKHRLVTSLREKLRDKKRNYVEYSQILNYLQVQEKKEHQIEKQWYALRKRITELEK